MDELRPITDYINTALGTAALAIAAVAAKWIRDVVHRYFAYLEYKKKRWKEAGSLFPKDQGPLTPDMRRAIQVAMVDILKKMAADRRKDARTPPG
jgi:hypothetical protein